VLRTGELVLKKPFIVEPGLSVTPLNLIERADFIPDFIPHPDSKEATKFDRPVLKVKVIDPKIGLSESQWLEAKGPDGNPTAITFLGGRVGMIYRQKDTEPKDFRSTLVVTDPKGQELTRKTISVNDPLIYRGHWFYQSNYNPQDHSVSGIMVVREPGLWITYFGFASLLIGILWMFYLKPWLKKRGEVKASGS